MRALLAKVQLGPSRAMKDPTAARQRVAGAAARRASAWALALPALGVDRRSSRSSRSSGRSGSRCTCTICACRGSAGRSSARRTTSRRWPIARFWSAVGHTAVFVAATVTLELAGGLVLALALDRVVARRAGSCAPRCCCRGRCRPWSRRWSGASCSRAPPASPTRVARAARGDAADLVRRRRRGLGAARPRRRLEDDAVRGGAAARRTAEHRSVALRSGGGRRRRTVAAVHRRSRCRCSGRRCWSPCSSAPSTPSASSTSST